MTILLNREVSCYVPVLPVLGARLQICIAIHGGYAVVAHPSRVPIAAGKVQGRLIKVSKIRLREDTQSEEPASLCGGEGPQPAPLLRVSCVREQVPLHLPVQSGLQTTGPCYREGIVGN